MCCRSGLVITQLQQLLGLIASHTKQSSLPELSCSHVRTVLHINPDVVNSDLISTGLKNPSYLQHLVQQVGQSPSTG